MEKPYDEKFILISQFDDWPRYLHDSSAGNIVNYFRIKLLADEVEVIEDNERKGLIVRYKRHKLYYG